MTLEVQPADGPAPLANRAPVSIVLSVSGLSLWLALGDGGRHDAGMKLLMGLIWALGGAAAGTVVLGLAGAAYANLTNMTSREGATGYFIVGMALLGALLGLGVGLILYARGAEPGAWAARLGQGALGVMLLVALLATAVWGWMQLRESPVMVGNAQVQLMLEFRVAQAHAPATGPRDWLDVEVNTSSTHMPALLLPDKVRQEADQWVIPALQGPLIRAGNRLVVARIRGPEGSRDELFSPDMPRNPDPKAGWSPWAAPGQIFDAQGQPLPGPPLLEMRWRVRVYGQD